MKKNSDYWKSRFSQLEGTLHKKSLKIYQDNLKNFESALKEIEKEIATWYQRFANNNEISISDAKKWLKDNELKELRWSLEEYIKYGRENAINKQWMKELENASSKFHISRLEALELRIKNTIEQLYQSEETLLETHLEDTYKSGYYHSCFEIQKGLGIGFDVGTIDLIKLKKVLSNPWAADNKNYSDRIWQSKVQLMNELSNELIRVCLLGKSPDEAIRNIAKKFNVSKAQAGRLIMTESAFVSSAAQKDCFNDLDIEQYQILATLDSHTSLICRSLDGKVFDMNDYQVGITAPPFHPNCRTTTIPFFDDEFSTKINFEKEDIPADMKYSEWKEKYANSDVDDTQSINIERKSKSLTNDEKYAINKYIGSSSYILNEKLREGIPLSEYESKIVNDLDMALDKISLYSGNVTRSLTLYSDDIDRFMKDYEIGNVVNYQAYTSATIGETYNPKARVQLFIKSKNGRNITKYNESEQEILFKRNSNFLVTDVDRNDEFYIKIYMEEVE